ncbi:MAG: hemerythrin domain-containing protein [Neisseria zoodegmatis]|uniref:hemerythrin domain-containing protein n=1 Tax=Neisseria zoodegmatis TaxID=326523 RepID=UPI0026F1C737|nr:hemerythrin domain-containing protein [Neisseria zoodegmatis]MDO5068964.1 hemerythrin domain-containing protein [Neisseria zoodegmatis]
MKPLKRHPDLIERSREHHHTLVLCVRILRDAKQNHRDDIEAHLPDLFAHFAAEEAQFAPYWDKLDPALRQRFETEHALLRGLAAAPQYDDAEWNTRFATTLRDHARFEERELFPALEPFLD